MWWGNMVYCMKKKEEEQQQQHLFNSPLSRTTRMIRYQKGKSNLDLLEQEVSEWQ